MSRTDQTLPFEHLPNPNPPRQTLVTTCQDPQKEKPEENKL